MNMVDVLGYVVSAKECLSTEEANDYAYYLEKYARGDWSAACHKTLASLPTILSALEFELRADIAADAAKKSGKPDYRRAFKRIYSASPNDTYKGIWFDDNGWACACSGYHAIRLNNADALALDGLTTLSLGVPLDLNKVIPAPTDADNPLFLPSIAELAAFIKTETAAYKAQHAGKKPRQIIYRFSDGLTYVNAQYFLDILTAFGDNAEGMSCTTATKTSAIGEGEKPCNISIVVFRADAGDAVLCPIRVTDGKTGAV